LRLKKATFFLAGFGKWSIDRAWNVSDVIGGQTPVNNNMMKKWKFQDYKEEAAEKNIRKGDLRPKEYKNLFLHI